MRTDLFDFHLPEDRIALRPASPRDAARLLVVGEGLEDRIVRDLPSLLRAGDCLVFNDTRVIPAQLEGRRGAASIGATLHKREGRETGARSFATPSGCMTAIRSISDTALLRRLRRAARTAAGG